MGVVNLYVPVAADRCGIREGSAVVSSQGLSDAVLIVDYEDGLLFEGAAYVDLAVNAASRHLNRYPTVARAQVSRDELKLVGELDEGTGEMTVTDEETLERWRPGAGRVRKASFNALTRKGVQQGRWEGFNEVT